MKRRILFIVMVVAVLGGVAWVFLRLPPEPVYKGKTLSTWTEEMMLSGPPWNRQQQQQWAEVIHQIGTNGIPTWLRMLDRHDSKLKLQFIALAKKQPWIKTRFTPAATWNYGAMSAFQIMGDTASNAVPALIKISEKGLSPQSRGHALIALADLPPQHKKALPALMRSLQDSNPSVRQTAAISLLYLGIDAKEAVPVLLQALKDQDPSVRGQAAQTLKSIDPQAAEEVGLK